MQLGSVLENMALSKDVGAVKRCRQAARRVLWAMADDARWSGQERCR